MSVLPGATPVDQFPPVAQVVVVALLFQSFVVCALAAGARRRRLKRLKAKG